MHPAKPTWADGAVMPLNLDAWWNEQEYKVRGTFQTRGYFILRKLHELDPVRVLAVTANLYAKDDKQPQDIPMAESDVALGHLGASAEEVQCLHVHMGKRREETG